MSQGGAHPEAIRATKRSYGFSGRRGFGWDAWIMEPGGLWFWIGRAWTRAGAIRMARHFRDHIQRQR